VKKHWNKDREELEERWDEGREKLREDWDEGREKVREDWDEGREKVREDWDEGRRDLAEVRDGFEERVRGAGHRVFEDVAEARGEFKAYEEDPYERTYDNDNDNDDY
jgi:hypothetical protein